jgi:hypothetical protein
MTAMFQVSDLGSRRFEACNPVRIDLISALPSGAGLRTNAAQIKTRAVMAAVICHSHGCRNQTCSDRSYMLISRMTAQAGTFVTASMSFELYPDHTCQE